MADGREVASMARMRRSVMARAAGRIRMAAATTAIAVSCAVTSASAMATTFINVSTSTQLANAVATANANGGDTTIILADGTYTLADTLYVNAPGVTIRSQSGNRSNVIVQGDAMSAAAVVKNLIRAAASSFTIQDVTLRRSGWHLLQVAGESNADGPVVRNVIFRDAYQQMLKVSQDPANPSVTSDGGLVENCLFEYTAGIGPEYYIGGIDAHGSKNWVIRKNTFRNIIAPDTTTAEHAIHIWDAPASGNLVEKNLIINCDRGIGFGLGTGRGNTGGIIRNNMIYHAAGNGSFADVAIGLEESPGTQVYNNTIFFQNGYPNAIEYRFPLSTGVLVSNNVTNRSIAARDGATGTVTGNLTNAAASWFVDSSTGDLHLASVATPAVDAGTAVSGLVDDFDGESRPQGSANDVGADEFLGTPPRLRFHTLSPCRVYDTRNASGPAAGAPLLAAGETRTVAIIGRCGIPATARSLSVNLTVTGPTAPGSLNLYAADLAAAPLTSTISFAAGATRANNALVKMAADGSGIKVVNGSTGPTHFILDANGWFE